RPPLGHRTHAARPLRPRTHHSPGRSPAHPPARYPAPALTALAPLSPALRPLAFNAKRLSRPRDCPAQAPRYQRAGRAQPFWRRRLEPHRLAEALLHDLVGAAADRAEAGVAEGAFDAELGYVAVAAEDL